MTRLPPLWIYCSLRAVLFLTSSSTEKWDLASTDLIFNSLALAPNKTMQRQIWGTFPMLTIWPATGKGEMLSVPGCSILLLACLISSCGQNGNLIFHSRKRFVLFCFHNTESKSQNPSFLLWFVFFSDKWKINSPGLRVFWGLNPEEVPMQITSFFVQTSSS